MSKPCSKAIPHLSLLQRCHCGGKLMFVAAIMSRDAIERILDQLGIPGRAPEFAPP